MRSLFLRIFFWFWVAMAIVVGLLVVLSPAWTRVRPAFARWEQRTFARMAHEAETAGQLLKEGGAEGMRVAFRWLDMPPHATLFLLDERMVDIYGQQVPPPVRSLAERAAAQGQTELERDGPVFMIARPVTDAQGRSYILAMMRGGGRGSGRPSAPRAIQLLEPRALAPILALIVLVVGGLCYWLARYLTAPVATLRRATRRLSGGDLTARVGSGVGRRRDEIGDLARDFDAMAERLEALIGTQRRLLRDVSHELRSPLARLEVALELSRQRAGEGAQEALDRIGRESARLNEMIEQLLTLQRLEAGGAPRESMTIDLPELLADVAGDARFEARSRGVAVRLLPTPPRTVSGSPELLRSAVDNVVRNAVAYSSRGDEVEIECTLADDADGRWVVVEVRDPGPGVPEQDLEHLFEPFFRVSDARDRASGGTGLGLAITERAVQLHGGSVAARNRSEGGLAVVLRLPATG